MVTLENWRARMTDDMRLRQVLRNLASAGLGVAGCRGRDAHRQLLRPLVVESSRP